MKLVGKSEKDLDKYPLDFFSIGHFILGHLTCIIIFFMALFIPFEYLRNGILQHFLLITCIFGLGWEIFENNVLINTKLKKERDSLNNSLCDILCVILGSIMCAFIIFHFFENLLIFVFITVILLTIEFSFFYVCGFVTYAQEK